MSAVASTLPIQAMKIEKVKECIGAIVMGIALAQPIDGVTPKNLVQDTIHPTNVGRPKRR
jgi:hypothetical protein